MLTNPGALLSPELQCDRGVTTFFLQYWRRLEMPKLSEMCVVPYNLADAPSYVGLREINMIAEVPGLCRTTHPDSANGSMSISTGKELLLVGAACFAQGV